MKFSSLRSAVLVGAGLSGLLLVSSCTYTKGTQDIPTPCNINAAKVTYNNGITGLLQANCYQCHSSVTQAAGGNHNWQDFKQLHTYALNGNLLHSLEHKDTDESKYMPLGGPKLSDCDIRVFQAWVANGAPEN